MPPREPSSAHAYELTLAVLPAGPQGRDPEQAVRGVLDLERRVVDLEAAVELLLELASDAVAVLVPGHEHVGRERGKARGDLPDVQVVDVGDARMQGSRGSRRAMSSRRRWRRTCTT